MTDVDGGAGGEVGFNVSGNEQPRRSIEREVERRKGSCVGFVLVYVVCAVVAGWFEETNCAGIDCDHVTRF